MSKSFFSLDLFRRRSNETIACRECISLLFKKNQKANFRSRDDDDDDDDRQLRARRRRARFKKRRAALCAPCTHHHHARARAEEVRGERESRRRTGPASLFSRASLVTSRGVLFNARNSEETAINPETWRKRNRFKREKISTRKREKERAGREFGIEKSALDKRAEDAFLRGLIRTFACLGVCSSLHPNAPVLE